MQKSLRTTGCVNQFQTSKSFGDVLHISLKWAGLNCLPFLILTNLLCFLWTKKSLPSESNTFFQCSSNPIFYVFSRYLYYLSFFSFWVSSFLSYFLVFFSLSASLQWAESHCTWAYVNYSMHQILPWIQTRLPYTLFAIFNGCWDTVLVLRKRKNATPLHRWSICH